MIIPVYNAGKHIRDTLDSVMSQDYKNVEIVLVDDNSKDSSAAIIGEYLNKYGETIIYHKFSINQGAGAARNKALELAKGQYVAFLDSDDLWVDGKLSKQIQLMEKTKSPFAYAAIEMIDVEGKQIKPKRNIRESCDYKYLLQSTIIATSSVVVNREVLGDFRMPLRRGGQDYATWLMLLRNGEVARGFNEVLVKYRVAAGSLSSNKFKSIRQVWEIQTQDEGINKISALFNVSCFIVKALLKYVF